MAIVGLRSSLKKSSPAKLPQFLMNPVFWKTAATVGSAVIPGLVQGIGGLSARKKAKQNQEMARKNLEAAQAKYMGTEFVNPYEDLQNPYAENIYEDLTVDTQAAQFARQQSQQSQANIMQGLQGAAGASGIAGLAQAMASQDQLRAQKAAAGIATQEQKNRALRLKGEQQRRKGAQQVDMLQRKGEAYKRSQELKRIENMFGYRLSQEEAADTAVTTANQMLQKGISKGLTGLTGLYGTGGEFEGKIGEHLSQLFGGIKLPFGNQGAGADDIITTDNMNEQQNIGWDDLYDIEGGG